MKSGKALVLAAVFAVGSQCVVFEAAAQVSTAQPTDNCAPSDKIDASTADSARKKLEAAGYSDVTKLYKGCDNVWHSQARSGGTAVNVMLAPDGSIHQETN